MKVLKELLDARGYSNFLALSYGADLAWFERLLHQHLQGAGVRRFVLVLDEQQLSATLAGDADVARGAGRWYFALGMRSAGSFHPKAYLLTGEAGARLYVGSGNLNGRGLDLNREVMERWDVGRADASIPSAFDVFRRYVGELVRSAGLDADAELGSALDATFGVEALQRPTVDGDALLIGSPAALWGRLPKAPTPANELTLTAPFFDEEGALTVDLAAELGATSFEVLTDSRMTNLTPAGVLRIREAGGAVRLLPPSSDERVVHAKAWFARGSGWSLSVHGSANLSEAAWRGQNAELIVTRTGAAAERVSTLLSDLRGQTVELDATLEAVLAERAARRQQEDPVMRTPNNFPRVHANWTPDRQVRLGPLADAAEDCVVTFLVEGEEQRATHLSWERHDGIGAVLATPPPTVSRERATVVRLGLGDDSGPWLPVHDPWELSERAREVSSERARMEAVLESGLEDASEVEGLLETLAAIYQARQELLTRPTQSRPASSGEGGQRPQWVALRAQDTELARPPEHTLGIPALGDPVKLIHRLLWGDLDLEDADATDAEPTDEDVVAGGQPTPSPSAGTLEGRVPFSVVAAAVVDEYRRSLSREQPAARSAVRLLEDAEVLCVALQQALRLGMEVGEFLTLQASVLRILLGGAHEPLPRALAGLEDEHERIAMWSRAPFLPATSLLVYNLCLSDLTAAPAGKRWDIDFPDAGPVLWMRNVLRHAPSRLDELLAAAERQFPRLRRLGRLWLADDASSKSLPFESFVRRMVADSRALVELAEALSADEGAMSAREWRKLVEEGCPVVALTREGVVPGFSEREDRKTYTTAYLQTGAFMRPDAEPHTRFARMRPIRADTKGVFALEAVRQWAKATGDRVGPGVRVLERLAGEEAAPEAPGSARGGPA